MRLDDELDLASDADSLDYQWVSDGDSESSLGAVISLPYPLPRTGAPDDGRLADVIMHAEAQRIVEAVRAGVFDVASLQESVARLAVCLEREAQEQTVDWLRREEDLRQSSPEYAEMSDVRYAVARGRLEVVKQLYKQGFRATTAELDLAVLKGHIDVAEWLYAIPERVAPGRSTIKAAIQRSHEDESLAALELFAPCFSQQPDSDSGDGVEFTEAFDCAVENEVAFHVLEYLALQGVRGSPAAIVSAVRQGNDDRLVWLLDELHVPPGDEAVVEAIRCTNERMVRLLEARGAKVVGLTPEDVDAVLESGNLTLARWLHQSQEVRGSQNASAMHEAIQRNDLDTLKLLLEYKYPDESVNTVLAALEEHVRAEVLQVLVSSRGLSLCQTVSTILMPWQVGDRVKVAERIRGRHTALQSIYRGHSLFAYTEPGLEATVTRVCCRNDDFFYDVEWVQVGGCMARAFDVAGSRLIEPLKEIVQVHDHTPFLAFLAISKAAKGPGVLSPTGMDKMLTLLQGRVELVNAQAWKVILPYLLDKETADTPEVTRLRGLLPQDATAMVDLIRGAAD